MELTPPFLIRQAGMLAGANELVMLVITFNTKDYPNEYVVRIHLVSEAGPVATEYCSVFKPLEQARACIPQRHFACIGRSQGDDPVIVETWL